MKNLLKTFMLVILLISFSRITSLSATQTNSAVLTLKIYNSGFLSVTNITGDVDLGNLVANKTNTWPGTSKRALWKNNGTERADYSVRGEIIAGGVTLVSNTPASNQIRVRLIFGQWDKNYSLTNYLGDDTLSTTYKAATSSVFAVDSDADNLKGYDVLAGEDRNMMFWVNPGKASNGLEVKIRIWVKANAG